MVRRTSLAVLMLLLLGCKTPPKSSGEAEPAPAPDTVVEVRIEERPTAPSSASAPKFEFEWPREGRLAVTVTSSIERSGGAAGEQATTEESSWVWTLAGLSDGVLRMASSSRPGSVTVNADGSLASADAADAALWTRLVGVWVGREVTEGNTFEADGALGVVGYRGVSTPARVRGAVLGRVPCREHSRDLRCHELEFRSEPAGEAGALLAELQAGVGAEQSVRDVEVLEHIKLRTVGSSLTPMKLTIESIARLRLRAPDGTEIVERTREERVYVFDWTK